MILNLEAEEDPPANNGRDREKSKQPFSGYIVRDRGRTLFVLSKCDTATRSAVSKVFEANYTSC